MDSGAGQSPKKVDPAISKWYSDISKKRKENVGGFKNPEVQKKIQAAKAKKKLGSGAEG